MANGNVSNIARMSWPLYLIFVLIAVNIGYSLVGQINQTLRKWRLINHKLFGCVLDDIFIAVLR